MNKHISALVAFFGLLFSLNAFAAKKTVKKKKVTPQFVEEKVYSVPETKPEILIGNQAQIPVKKSERRPDRFYYFGLSTNALTYKIPSLIPNATKFKQDLPGIAIGRKTANNLFFYRGYFELDGEWMRFKRSSSVFEQKLNVFQVNIIQNVDLALSYRHSVYFSAGLGVAPMFLLGEQSVFGNSFDHFGMSGILKFDFMFPLKNKYELDFGLKGQWGRAGRNDLFLSGLNLGLNFE